MKIELNRESRANPTCTIGELLINGARQCSTLEDPVRELEGQPVGNWKIPHKTAIPRGTYRVIITMSNRFKKMLPELLNVPGFAGVRIHSGNTAEDTEGCILVGDTKLINKIGLSRPAFSALMTKIQEAIDRKEEVTIMVS